ncbi:MAG: hypothetical protein OXU61_02690 [Gammaproteobacteria bacterium]|nr:hypothetical protein [Gammaproteobacteria bacterium]
MVYAVCNNDAETAPATGAVSGRRRPMRRQPADAGYCPRRLSPPRAAGQAS